MNAVFDCSRTKSSLLQQIFSEIETSVNMAAIAKMPHQEDWSSYLGLGIGLALGSGFGLQLQIWLGLGIWLGLALGLALEFGWESFAIPIK